MFSYVVEIFYHNQETDSEHDEQIVVEAPKEEFPYKEANKLAFEKWKSETTDDNIFLDSSVISMTPLVYTTTTNDVPEVKETNNKITIGDKESDYIYAIETTIQELEKDGGKVVKDIIYVYGNNEQSALYLAEEFVKKDIQFTDFSFKEVQVIGEAENYEKTTKPKSQEDENIEDIVDINSLANLYDIEDIDDVNDLANLYELDED